ncbi:MAG: adenosylmethionine decarboxylase [Candidatus Izemoplasmataceae bacterium]|jgi:S-adenosylmethionine decarboxylase
MAEKLALYGFNNLTKSLSFNIYDICVTETKKEREAYIKYIDEMYNSKRLTEILEEVTARIGANILNISKQDYEPQGASVTILISEEEVPLHALDDSCNLGKLTPTNDTVVAHLDKSHITVHSYPESHPEKGVSTFRVDIDVSTCGEISPLNALDYLISSFDSDIITVDYRVRGFTRLANGKKVFIDHDIDTIQDYIKDETVDRYTLIDVNIYQENIFHTKMMLKELDLNNYLFGKTKEDITASRQRNLLDSLRREMKEIFYGMNLYEK